MEGSSVDPEHFETRNPEDSLTNMSDLEKDAESSSESLPPTTGSRHQSSASPSSTPGDGGHNSTKATGVTDNAKVDVSFAIGQLYINEGAQSMPSSSNLSKLPSPEQDIYHALLVCHRDDGAKVQILLQKLSQLKLPNNKPFRIAMEEDVSPSGVPETKAFDSSIKNSIISFLFITESFVKDNSHKWKGDVGLTTSFTSGSDIDGEPFLIPIFTENKDTAPYLKDEYCLRSVKGIKYHGCSWNDYVKAAFLKELNEAEARFVSNRQELPAPM